jgi:outer membrane lipoprotein-sorting protein
VLRGNYADFIVNSRIAVLAACTAALAFAGQAAAQTADAAAILEQSRAAYAALDSYADTGEVLVEYRQAGAPPSVERHRFTTFYEAPRQFYFRFDKDPNAAKEAFVIWCPGDEFQTWWSATRVHEIYPQGQGATAFALGTLPTQGSALIIPSLLFPTAGLQGPLATFEAPRYAGIAEIGGRQVHELSADVRMNHWNDVTRPTTVWIDAETFLVLRVREGSPSDGPAGLENQVTTSFEPRANPELDESRFRFEVPQ